MQPRHPCGCPSPGVNSASALFLPRTAAYALVLVAVVLAACQRAAQVAAKTPPTKVDVVQVSLRDVPVAKEWIGTLDGRVNADIHSQVSGYLLKQDYREGSVVHMGQLPFEIDPRPFQAALNQAKGNLAQAEGMLQQAKGNLAQGARPPPATRWRATT